MGYISRNDVFWPLRDEKRTHYKGIRINLVHVHSTFFYKILSKRTEKYFPALLKIGIIAGLKSSLIKMVL